MEPQRQTWLTIYSSTLISQGRVGYSFYYKHDQGEKSYTGVFKAQIRDSVHAEICSLGAALKHALSALKGVKLVGLTIYTDCAHTRAMLEQFRVAGYVPTSDINQSYVVGLNVLLSKVKRLPLKVHKIQVNREEWMKASVYRKIKRVKSLEGRK